MRILKAEMMIMGFGKSSRALSGKSQRILKQRYENAKYFAKKAKNCKKGVDFAVAI